MRAGIGLPWKKLVNSPLSATARARLSRVPVASAANAPDRTGLTSKRSFMIQESGDVRISTSSLIPVRSMVESGVAQYRSRPEKRDVTGWDLSTFLSETVIHRG